MVAAMLLFSPHLPSGARFAPRTHGMLAQRLLSTRRGGGGGLNVAGGDPSFRRRRLTAIARGAANKEIADARSVSVKTVNCV
jgi:DNA-binding NarL/FixJ family response regulator